MGIEEMGAHDQPIVIQGLILLPHVPMTAVDTKWMIFQWYMVGTAWQIKVGEKAMRACACVHAHTHTHSVCHRFYLKCEVY